MDGGPGLVRKWIYKSGETGKPRRFLNHREAVLWAVLTVGKFFGVFALYWLTSVILDSWGGDEAGGPILTFVLLAILLAVGLLISLVLYLYVALSGGIMDDEARKRYRNNETFGPR